MKDIPGYEGLYAVTSCGKVWGHKRKKFLKPDMRGNGYLYVGLCKNNIVHKYNIHQLVAITYLPNPDNLPQINHKDENKLNNCLQNLEWCDAKYNCNYGTRTERAIQDKRKPVEQYDLNGNLIKVWDSIAEAGRAFGSHNNISHCITGKQKTAYGYIWKCK